MNAYEFTLSLRIRHPNIDPAEITRALAIEPQHTWKAGEPRRGPADETLAGVYRESYWMGRLTEGPQLSSDSVTVETVLLDTLVQLRRVEPFLAVISEGGGEAEFHVSMYARENFRLELASRLLSVLGRLGMAVAFDVYAQPHDPG
ncbi:MAG: hypothetical protein JWN85_3217 [Gammaproteobacteria bacterium]|nr:hypothetical protein [Gammaproteobacteria bacterium]